MTGTHQAVLKKAASNVKILHQAYLVRTSQGLNRPELGKCCSAKVECDEHGGLVRSPTHEAGSESRALHATEAFHAPFIDDRVRGKGGGGIPAIMGGGSHIRLQRCPSPALGHPILHQPLQLSSLLHRT